MNTAYQTPEPFTVPDGGLASFLSATTGSWAEDENITPNGGISNVSRAADQLAQFGRNGDTYMVHAAEGETFVPREVLEANPGLKESLFSHMRRMGVENPERYVVGSGLNSLNPVTGQPEFFFKSLKKFVKGVVKVIKKAAPVVLPFVIDAFLPGVGSFAAGALGSGLGSLMQGASIKDSLKAAAIGGFTAGALKGINNTMAGKGFFSGALPTDQPFKIQTDNWMTRPFRGGTPSSSTTDFVGTTKYGGTAEYIGGDRVAANIPTGVTDTYNIDNLPNIDFMENVPSQPGDFYFRDGPNVTPDPRLPVTVSELDPIITRGDPRVGQSWQTQKSKGSYLPEGKIPPNPLGKYPVQLGTGTGTGNPFPKGTLAFDNFEQEMLKMNAQKSASNKYSFVRKASASSDNPTGTVYDPRQFQTGNAGNATNTTVPVSVDKTRDLGTIINTNRGNPNWLDNSGQRSTDNWLYKKPRDIIYTGETDTYNIGNLEPTATKKGGSNIQQTATKVADLPKTEIIPKPEDDLLTRIRKWLLPSKQEWMDKKTADAQKLFNRLEAQGRPVSKEAQDKYLLDILSTDPTFKQLYGKALTVAAPLAMGVAQQFGAFDPEPFPAGGGAGGGYNQAAVEAERNRILARRYGGLGGSRGLGGYLAGSRQGFTSNPALVAGGGEMYPERIGAIDGPGTGVSDDVPALLSDGEFVMTARAVRGAGDGSRDKGVRKMYQMMRRFEGGAV